MIDRRHSGMVASFICATLCALAVAACRADGTGGPAVQAVFNGGCEGLLLSQVARARSEILVAAYSITRPAIVGALIEACHRGVRVKVKYDAKQADYEGMKDALDDLRRHGIKCWPIWIPETHASMHDKFMVIDRRLVLTGSYNYTSPASEMNYENLVLIQLPAVADTYAAEFAAIRNR